MQTYKMFRKATLMVKVQSQGHLVSGDEVGGGVVVQFNSTVLLSQSQPPGKVEVVCKANGRPFRVEMPF